jgi:hypothetical protein
MAHQQFAWDSGNPLGGYIAPMSGQPFMVGGQRRRQRWYCNFRAESLHCGGGNCMKAHTNDRRRFKLECGMCFCDTPY